MGALHPAEIGKVSVPKAILKGHLHQSRQIADHVSVDTAGHLAKKQTRR